MSEPKIIPEAATLAREFSGHECYCYEGSFECPQCPRKLERLISAAMRARDKRIGWPVALNEYDWIAREGPGYSFKKTWPGCEFWCDWCYAVEECAPDDRPNFPSSEFTHEKDCFVSVQKRHEDVLRRWRKESE